MTSRWVLQISKQQEKLQIILELIITIFTLLNNYFLKFSIQEGIGALEEVIYHVETFDETWSFFVKVQMKSLVATGYSHKAPNNEEFHQKICQKIKAFHLYDYLRTKKLTSAWGVEACVPFLDIDFIRTAMDIDPEWKVIRPDLGRMRSGSYAKHLMMIRSHIYQRTSCSGRRSSLVMVSVTSGFTA